MVYLGRSPYGFICAGYRTTVKLLSDTLSLPAPDICPRKLIVKLCVVLALADPTAAANARLLPQLCPLQGCAEELIANSSLPAYAVSAAAPERDRIEAPAQPICGVNPVAVPWCRNW